VNFLIASLIIIKIIAIFKINVIIKAVKDMKEGEKE